MISFSKVGTAGRTTRILNVEIENISAQELLTRLDRGVLVTPNVDHVMKLQRDREFYECYRQAEWVVCDSRILYLCGKLLGSRIPEAIPGSSFFPAYCAYHRSDADCRLFLLGGRGGVAAAARERINSRAGREMVVGACSPSEGFERDGAECARICSEISGSGANVVVVGVGAPKQEKWIMAHRGRVPEVKLWMALGATIDFEAGRVKRAPEIVRRLSLEWLWRFSREPRRLFRRYFIDDMPFFWEVLKQRMGLYRDPFG